MPSELTECEDPTAAYILNRAVWMFGSFVESETSRYRYHSKETGSGKSKKHEHPTDLEVAEYRRALIEGTPFDRKAAKPKAQVSLADFAKRTGQGGGGRQIVQEPGKGFRVES